MKSFQVLTLIHATPATIWNLLADASQYTVWNPTVTKVEGRIAPGQKVVIHAKINPGRAFPVKVTEFIPDSRMVWTGGMPLGLFKGERTFTLTPRVDGLVEFRMSEVFGGLLFPLIERSIPDMQPVFEEFASALKRQAEAAN